ncbi:uncharacterized protein LOC136074701 [Hydra vulgaris]|uniref:Uncharacterized protein LOC136074701 n=1 Tax=Hydra vulgaris TaxID=6087 RepID=A0ABM4B2S3_HYDVU
MKSDKIISNEDCNDIPTDSGINITGNTKDNDEIDFNVELNNMNGPQIDISAKMIKSLENKLLEIDCLIYKLNKELSLNKIGTIEWFATNNKVTFYTGLTNIKMLMTLYDFICNDIPYASVLSKFSKLTLSFKRLRLNLTLKDLAYRFEISNSTVSSVFIELTDVLFIYLRQLLKWPAREQIWKTTPNYFWKHFARTQTFSSYKHHNTVKFLIGVSPQGVIGFISKAWGGRTSDKHLVENCKILNLLPGDIVMADRGFNIDESVAVYCASVKIPAFTKGKRQLDSIDVEQTRHIASVRIHVERVIGNLKNKYTILQDVKPLDYLIRKDNSDYSSIDKIAIASCGLTNMCDSVIPVD